MDQFGFTVMWPAGVGPDWLRVGRYLKEVFPAIAAQDEERVERIVDMYCGSVSVDVGFELGRLSEPEIRTVLREVMLVLAEENPARPVRLISMPDRGVTLVETEPETGAGELLERAWSLGILAAAGVMLPS